MRHFAITGIVTASWMLLIISGSDMRATPPSRRMSAGTRSSAITAQAPASSAIFACSALTTSMITPPLSISARPLLTRIVPVSCMAASLSPARGASGRRAGRHAVEHEVEDVQRAVDPRADEQGARRVLVRARAADDRDGDAVVRDGRHLAAEPDPAVREVGLALEARGVCAGEGQRPAVGADLLVDLLAELRDAVEQTVAEVDRVALAGAVRRGVLRLPRRDDRHDPDRQPLRL